MRGDFDEDEIEFEYYDLCASELYRVNGLR